MAETQNKDTINAEKDIKLRIGQKETLAICVSRTGAPCDKCTRQGYCLAECADFMEWEKKHPQRGGIYTGQEAIERMARAIYKALYGKEPTNTLELNGLGFANSKRFAEAALNSLLQEQ